LIDVSIAQDNVDKNKNQKRQQPTQQISEKAHLCLFDNIVLANYPS